MRLPAYRNTDYDSDAVIFAMLADDGSPRRPLPLDGLPIAWAKYALSTPASQRRAAASSSQHAIILAAQDAHRQLEKFLSTAILLFELTYGINACYRAHGTSRLRWHIGASIAEYRLPEGLAALFQYIRIIFAYHAMSTPAPRRPMPYKATASSPTPPVTMLFGRSASSTKPAERWPRPPHRACMKKRDSPRASHFPAPHDKDAHIAGGRYVITARL